jgi:hypothetical protein
MVKQLIQLKLNLTNNAYDLKMKAIYSHRHYLIVILELQKLEGGCHVRNYQLEDSQQIELEKSIAEENIKYYIVSPVKKEAIISTKEFVVLKNENEIFEIKSIYAKPIWIFQHAIEVSVPDEAQENESSLGFFHKHKYKKVQNSPDNSPGESPHTPRAAGNR